MKKAVLLIFTCFIAFSCFSQPISVEEVGLLVSDFIEKVKLEDKTNLAKNVRYPLKRTYPIPPINNVREFEERYHEIFDKKLVAAIISSDPNEDWGGVGYRGIMMGRGLVWLDFDGLLIAVNSVSAFEEHKINELLDLDRSSLHPAIQAFEKSILVMETKDHRVRIDMVDGKYRYASWKLNKGKDEFPDVLIENGNVFYEGSEGNHRYEFTKNEFLYIVSIQVIGYDDSYGDLYIYKGNAKTFDDVWGDESTKLILEQQIISLAR